MVVVVLGGFLFGFDMVVINGVVDVICGVFGLNVGEIGIIVLCVLFGLVVGVWYVGLLVDCFGCVCMM